ncbi:MAG: DNA primase [Acidiferrobacterales bacterium]
MAGRIPEKFIDDLLARTDIVDVIDKRVPLRKAGKEYKACCPFHEEKTPSFTVSQTKQFYHCFGCGAHGTAIGFLMEYERMSFPEAIKELAAQAGMQVPEEAHSAEAAAKAERTADLLDLLAEAEAWYRKQLKDRPDSKQAVDYLKGRGLTGEIAASFGIGYAPDGWDNLLKALGTSEERIEGLFQAGMLIKKDKGGYYDRFRQRIMFPIHDYRGRVVGFGGRILGDGEPKYLNSPETPVFHKGREAYGLYHARDAIRREQRVLVVEGYMDVVALAQFGIDYAVATLGTATTHEHLERLFRYAPEVVFAFDGDRAGREAAWRALETALPELESGRQVSFLFLPEGEDPDTMVRKEGAENFALRIRQAQSLPAYLEEELRSQVDMSRLDGRTRMLELARPLVAKMPPGIFREMIINRLGEISRVNPEKLSTLLGFPGSTAPIGKGSQAKSGRPKKGQPSLMRRIIARLVQNPELAALVDEPEHYRQLDIAGADLFCELVALLHREPQMKTGVLLERFRDSEHFGPLQKLAAWSDVSAERPDEEHDLEREFRDSLVRLKLEGMQAHFDALASLEKTEGGLSEADRRRYWDLIRQIDDLKGFLTGKSEHLD